MRTDGAVPAYAALFSGPGKVRRLGPSFLAEVLYFAGFNYAEDSLRPLILDRFVVTALNDAGVTRWPTTGAWWPSQYTAYLEMTQRSASTWDECVQLDVVEYALFGAGKRR